MKNNPRDGGERESGGREGEGGGEIPWLAANANGEQDTNTQIDGRRRRRRSRKGVVYLEWVIGSEEREREVSVLTRRAD